MNLYDFAGNLEEWTLEHSTYSSTDIAVIRGGYYTTSGNDDDIVGSVIASDVASGRSPTNTKIASQYFTFRATFY